MCAELHITSDNFIVIRFLHFDVEKPARNVRFHVSNTREDEESRLVSPLETSPMLSNGSCLTGLSLSHGVEDLRVRGRRQLTRHP